MSVHDHIAHPKHILSNPYKLLLIYHRMIAMMSLQFWLINFPLWHRMIRLKFALRIEKNKRSGLFQE